MLTITITLRKIYFLANFRIFSKVTSSNFAKNGKNKKISGLNANGLEIKLRVQRGMAFLIWTFINNIASKKLIS